MSVKIKAVAKALPAYTRTTTEVIPFLEAWLVGQDDRFIRKVKKIVENARVDRRYSIMPPERVFTNMPFEERNRIYSKEIIKLGKACLEKALQKANWQPADLDYIITVSCTGIMIPSVDAYLVNDLNLRQDIIRLPVTEMGCAAGVAGMIYAKQFLKAHAGKRAAVLALESPMATFQLEDFSMANVVSAAIFGDGAACVLLSSVENDEGPELMDEGMYHFYDSTHLMGFDMTNSGLRMVLDIDVPETISAHFPRIINPFLDRNKLTIQDIDYLIFHPGGKKIIQVVEQLFGVFGKDIQDTKEVLRAYGNMSSATVFYVLERFMERKYERGKFGLMLSFGPGFSAQKILLRW